MGCDIHGAIETRPHGSNWYQTGSLVGLVGRSYDTFGMLWGVRNSAAFAPSFDNRGFPDNLSRRVRKRIDEWGGMDNLGNIDFHSASYATVEELQNVDWSEQAEGRDSRYSVLDENKEPTGTKFGWAAGWAEIINEHEEELANGKAIPNESGEHYIKRMKLTRRRALSGSWDWLIFELLETYADKFGPENVRLVVWFDN